MDRAWFFQVLISLALVKSLTAVIVEQQGLLGCGVITRPTRTYQYSPANYDFTSNTPGTCMQACSAAGYAYASVSAGRLCFCGSLTVNTSLLNATSTSCQVNVCTGDSNYYCGDMNYELVYASVGIIDSASIALTGGGSPMSLTVNQNYQFTLGYVGAVNFINYLVDFGDGTTTGWISGILNAATNISHVFPMTGQFAITVSARSLVGMQPMISAMTVQVSDSISALDVSITCPNVTTTFKTVSCLLTSVRGTGLTATFNYNSTGMVDSIVNIPDAQYYTYGSSYVTNNPTVDSSTNLLNPSDIAILPQSTVTVNGQIGSIQFYSSGSGPITIYLLRRTCTSPTTYCYGSNICGTCANAYSLQCSPSIYSSISQLCVNSTSNQRFQQSNYNGIQFNIVAQWAITPTGAGYQQIIANAALNQTALVGDILAFQGSYIAKEISMDSTQDYRCVIPIISGNAFTCNIGNLSSNNTQYRYLLQITIIQGIQIAPNTIYPNTGNFYVQGTITQNNLTSISASTVLPVLYGIQWIEIVGPPSASANMMTSFVANIYPVNATATLYIWYINNNNTYNSTSNTFNVSFPVIGTYTIACQAQNLLSMALNFTTILIQDLITNFTLRAGNITNVSTSQPLEVARFQIRMLTGSNYVCTVNYDRSQTATNTYYYTYGYIPGSYVTHQYVQAGQYNVYATCSNTASNASYSLIHYVQYPIIGLQLQQNGVTKNTNYCLNFTIAQGTAPSFRVLVNGGQVNYTYYPQYQLVQTSTFPGQSSSMNFTVEIYAWNYLSSVYISNIFSIISLIVNPQIRASTTNANFPGPIFFEYTMDSGSNIQVSFSFGDTLANNPVQCVYNGDYLSNVWSSCAGTTHTFAIPGTITVIATFSNAISTVYKFINVTLSTSVNPIQVATLLQLPSMQCAAAYVDNRAIASFVIQAANTTVKPASNAQVVVIPDAVNHPAVTQGPFQLILNYFASPAITSSGLNVIYSSPGNYTVIFQVSNNIDSTNLSCVVQVVPILQQVYYSLIPFNWPLNSPTAFQVSVYIGDPNPGPVVYTWDFGDGTNISSPRTATQYYQADTNTHSYSSIGTYIMTVMATGPFNTVTKSFNVDVQYSVTSFNVNYSSTAGSSAQVSYSGSSVTISLSVQDTSSPSASSPYLLIDYNDTSLLATNSVINVSLPFTGSYTYMDPGVYYINFTAYNEVSTVTQIMLFSIDAQFLNYQFGVCYLLPTFTSPSNDQCSLTTTNGIHIPKQSQLVIYVTWSNPSAIPKTFQVLFLNAGTAVFNQTLSISQTTNVSELVGTSSGSPLYRLVIDLEGNHLLTDGAYTVQVTTRNPTYSAVYSLNISILTVITGLVISDENILVPTNTPKLFTALYQNFSSISCLYIKYFDNLIQCYGNAATCLSLPLDGSVNQSCSSVQPYTYTNTSITFTRAFNRSNAWLFAYAWNQVTSISAQAFLAFPLSTGACNLPVIQFNLYNPVIRWARQVERSKAFSVATNTILNCSQSLNNTKQWNILQCDTNTGKCSSMRFLNQLISQLSSAQTSEIYIQSQQLPLGTYLFNYTVSMNMQANFAASAYTYITIIASAIQVNMLPNGTSMITTGVTQSVLLQPGVYSIDPDSTYFNPNNWNFEYYCRIYGQASYPNFNGVELTIESTIVDPSNPSCFASPGNTSLFKYGPSNNQSILYIQPRALQSGRSYEYKVILTNIYDNTIQYTGYAIVQVQDINSVLISAKCTIKMCSSSVEYQRINPTTQATVTSDCLTCANAVNTVIQWNVYLGFQTGYPNDDIQWILFPNMDSYEDILFYGRNTKNLTAINELFLSNPSIQYWKFEASYTVTTTNGIVTSVGAVRFTINSPPVNGTCTTDQINGTTITPFQITCSNWVDSDGVEDYSFYVSTSANSSQVLIGYTTLKSISVYLPIGDPNANYAISLTAQIRDIYGAVTSFNFSTITVIPDNTSLSKFIQSSQLALTQGRGNDQLEKILYAGDQNQACQLMLSISQALNSIGSSIQQTATSGNLPAQDLYVSGLQSSGSTYPTTNTSANTSQALTAYTNDLNSAAIVRDYAVQFISNLSVTGIDSIKLQASAMSSLTDSTSELTRQTVILAASKCSDLVNGLNSMADSISYEDVQAAVYSIVQLASNILAGVNTALLNRGIVLGLDYDRANMLPPDYDADIESVWSNPNLFSDGDDFSWETIQKNRNLYYQQQSSNQIIAQMQDVLSKVVNILSYHLNVGQSNTISTDSISMLTEKIDLSDLNSLTIPQADGAQITLPSLPYCSLLLPGQSCSNNTPITLNSIVLPLATAGYNGRSQAIINVSRSVSLSLFDTSGTTLAVNNLTSPIKIIIPRDSNLILPPMTLQNVTGQKVSTAANNNRQFSLFYVNVTSPGPSLTLSATFELKSENLALGYMIIFRFDAIPVLNSSMNQTDGYNVFCPANQISTTSDGSLYSYFLDNTRTVNHQYAMFGIRELNPTEFSTYCSNTTVSNAPITDATVNFTSNYYIRAYTSACYYLDSNFYWQSSQLTVGTNTTHGATECYTTHLTTFAGGWIVLPAPINWNYVFANLDFAKNITIYLTIILITVLYIILMIYARYKDKKDVEKLGVTPLPDNLLHDKYYYQIIVFTGLRKDAGTTSKVHFVVSGDNEETGVRTFEDPHRKILQRGAIDSFIMAVPKSLGRLTYMRVWHDNSGHGSRASWFLKYIIVRDLQTMEKNHFISQQWFAVEKNDGVVDRVIPVAGEEQKIEFAYLLSKKTYHSLSDGHLWFSVFSRPPSTRFTRVQRCTCCFVLLLMSMLMNIMYYDQTTEAKTQTTSGIAVGPFLITPEQIAIGVIVELICFIPSTLLVEMFRRLRLRRAPVSPVREALRQIQTEHQQKQQQATINDIHPHLTNYIVNPDPILSGLELDKMRDTLISPLPGQQTSSIRSKQQQQQQQLELQTKKKPKTLPWWFIFIAYGLSFLIVTISAIFIMARGIEFGDTKTRKWLTSSISGFFSSILLTQPVKVVCLAIFFALVVRKDNDEAIESDHDDVFLNGDEEYLHAFDDGSLLTFRTKSGHIPLTPGEIAFARQKRLKEIKMWEILKELLAYASFLWILYVVSYSNRDPNAFYLMSHLRQDFLNINSQTDSFVTIHRIDQYWDWLSASFIPRLRANPWYNGAPPANLSGYISDKTNRILGWTTMRQLRVKENSCKIISSFANLIPSCEAEYNIFNEEQESYNPGWSSVYNSTLGGWTNYSASIRQSFLYNESSQLDTYSYVGDHGTYGGGGYVYEFRGTMNEMLGNISLLQNLSWINLHTRAVIIQMSLYNPNVNLFVFVTILVEFSSSGGVYPSARVEPLSLVESYQGSTLFKLICSIIYMVFIVYYMQREIRLMLSHRLAYLRDFWSYSEIGIIACSWAGVGVYVWRAHEGNRVGNLYKQNNGYAYVNLQLASYVNDCLTYLLAFCCFFGTIKFLRLLRFNHRMSLLSATLAYAAKDLFCFSLMFSVIYWGYLSLFFLLFHAKIWACSDLLKTAQMLFEMMLLKFDVSDLNAADAFLGPFCFSLFIIFVVFICMNMFISIIADSFRVIRHNVSLQNNEHEIVGFIFNQFKKWTGLGKTDEMDRLHMNPYDGTRVQYQDPITSFPDKMDELLIALNKIYMDTKRNDTFTFRPLDNISGFDDESKKVRKEK